MIDGFEIQRRDPRPRGIGFGQPANDDVDTRIQRRLVVERMPTCRPYARDLCLAARPEQRRAAQPGLFRADPDRFAAPPAAIADRAAIRQLETAQVRIAHGVVHDAVVIGHQPGDDAVVVGKRQRRIHRRHPARTHAFVRDACEVRRDSEIEIAGTETVERHQQHAALR
jgi:hypothetical protein